ncbi:hypothetical protein [Roseibium sp. LAB1]
MSGKRGTQFNYSDFDAVDDSKIINKAEVVMNFEEGFVYDDDDVVDIDLEECAEVDEMLVSVNGSIDYSPGDDITVEDILNEALNGGGNDTGVVLNNSNQLEDNDQAEGTTATNEASFNQTLNARGGDAVTDDGISAGGSSGSGSIDAEMNAFGGHVGNWFGHAGFHGMSVDLEGNLEIDDLGSGSVSVIADDDALVQGMNAAEASASNDASAFTNTLVQGENILNNSVDMTIVGGNMDSLMTGEDLGSLS